MILIWKDNFRCVGHWSLVLPVIQRNKQAISCIREASGRNFNGYQDFILIPTLWGIFIGQDDLDMSHLFLLLEEGK